MGQDTLVLEDYAPGIEDPLARVQAGAPRAATLPMSQFMAWGVDVETVIDRMSRGLYPSSVGTVLSQALDAVDAQLTAASRDVLDPTLSAESRDAATRRVGQIAQALRGMKATTTAAIRRIKEVGSPAVQALTLHTATLDALRMIEVTGGPGLPFAPLSGLLRAADIYSWAPQTTGAVFAAAETLPTECALTGLACGEIAPVGAAGFWVFTEPVDLQTVSAPHHRLKTLTWGRAVAPADDPRRPGVPYIRFAAGVIDVAPVRGREVVFAMPTTAWEWYEGTTLTELEQRLVVEYDTRYPPGRYYGPDFAGKDVTVHAAVALSRFFLSALTWLRQRVIVVESAPGLRQQTRQAQRAHNLAAPPRVQVVDLRRREMVHEATEAEAADLSEQTRKLSCRFVVRGFMRNQWYPSRGEHAPIWVHPFVKGPADAPFKDARPRVFAVRR